MATQTDLSAKRRTPLNRERVIGAALVLADTGGIASLTMRRLGQELGVEAMSLYNHVADKDDIIAGITDLVYSEIALPSGRAGWKTAMRRRAISAREALLRHPWASALMQSRTEPGPWNLRHHDSVIGTLRQAGFTIQMAAHAFSLMDSYIYGFAQQQQNLTYTNAREAAAAAENILQQLPADAYPHLAELITQHVMKPGYDYAQEFTFGLNLILDGLEKPHRAARR